MASIWRLLWDQDLSALCFSCIVYIYVSFEINSHVHGQGTLWTTSFMCTIWENEYIIDCCSHAESVHYRPEDDTHVL